MRVKNKVKADVFQGASFIHLQTVRTTPHGRATVAQSCNCCGLLLPPHVLEELAYDGKESS